MTYVCPSGWDAGCDTCGEYETFESESRAQEWTGNHKCPELEPA